MEERSGMSSIISRLGGGGGGCGFGVSEAFVLAKMGAGSESNRSCAGD